MSMLSSETIKWTMEKQMESENVAMKQSQVQQQMGNIERAIVALESGMTKIYQRTESVRYPHPVAALNMEKDEAELVPLAVLMASYARRINEAARELMDLADELEI